ncbi:hypothetical protein JOQ06_022046, partial [Pogonophryne albipinna]
DVSSDRLHHSSLLLTLRAKKKKIHQTSLSLRQVLFRLTDKNEVSLSIGDCEPLAIGYVRDIAKLVQNNYLIPKWHFSVAVNIPEDPEKLGKAFDNINLDEVKKTCIDKGKVYIGRNAVVAVPQRKDTYTDHAEAQVLDNLGNLANTHKCNILLLYSWLSPCGDKCTNRKNKNNILKKIEEKVKPKWESYAFVFHTVFTGPREGKQATEAEIQKTLRNLREVIKDDNIFRCYNPNNTGFRCVKCFVDASKTANPVDECVKK